MQIFSLKLPAIILKSIFSQEVKLQVWQDYCITSGMHPLISGLLL